MKRAAIVVGVGLLILSLLFVSFSPSAEVQRRPSAPDLQAARTVWEQLKRARGEAATEVRVDNRMISGLSALARDASGIDRIDAIVTDGELRGRASLRLPLGLWLNVAAATTGRHDGFPPFRLTVGRLTFPAAAGRPLANLARWALRMRGAKIPPLDELVEAFSVGGERIQARVKLPARTGLVDEVIATRSSAIEGELVESTLCRIAAAQRAEPVGTLPELVRRTFAEGPGTEGYNRAAFVALSLAVVGERAEALLPRGADIRTQCAFPDGELRLHDRADLAKHWVFSAGLTAVLGPQAAESLGEWKELDDSLPDGSGFSFVDLAADRAGVQTALLALAPPTAAATSEELGRATDDAMLPSALLEGPEGLTDASFVERFGSLEERDYREAVSRIDGVLAEQRSMPQ